MSGSGKNRRGRPRNVTIQVVQPSPQPVTAGMVRVQEADLYRAGGQFAPAGSVPRQIPGSGAGNNGAAQTPGFNQFGSNTQPIAAYYGRTNSQQFSIVMPPGDPIRPMSGLDDGTGAPRQWAIPAGFNIVPQPRQYELVGFNELRGLAATYEGVQLCEAAMFRVLDRLTLQVVPNPLLLEEGEEATADKWVTPAMEIAERLCDPENRDDVDGLYGWTKAAFRDLAELDAVGIYQRRTKSGGLYGLELVAGDSIACLGDAGGRTPLAPLPAYAQYLYGVPAGLYSAGEIDYLRTTRRTDSLYGISPVERIIVRINQALRKEQYDLVRFTDGATPEGILQTQNPALLDMTPDQVEEWERRWNAALAGLSALRVRTKAVPPGWTFESTRQKDIATEFDNFLLNVTVAAFGLTMEELGFTGSSNRSTGQSQENVVYRNAVRPITSFLARYLTRVNNRFSGTPLAPMAVSVSLPGQATKTKGGKWDKRFVIQFGGIDEPEDFQQRVSAYVELVKAGIVGPTQAKRDLKLHVKPGEIEIAPFVTVQGGIQSLVFIPDAEKSRDAAAQANSSSLAAQDQGAQAQVEGAKTDIATHQAAQKALAKGVHPETGMPLPHTPQGQQLAQQQVKAQTAQAQAGQAQADVAQQTVPHQVQASKANADMATQEADLGPEGRQKLQLQTMKTQAALGIHPMQQQPGQPGQPPQPGPPGVGAVPPTGQAQPVPVQKGTGIASAAKGATPKGAPVATPYAGRPTNNAAGAVGARRDAAGDRLRDGSGTAADAAAVDPATRDGAASPDYPDGDPFRAARVSDEWAAWREKALRAVKRSLPVPVWTAVYLPADVAAFVSDELTRAVDADDVRAIFLTARQIERGELPGVVFGRAVEPGVEPAVVAQHTGAMIAYMLPPDVAQRLALPGGADGVQDPADLHVTLAFLGDASELDAGHRTAIDRAVRAAVEDTAPIAGRISGVGRFAGQDGDHGDPVYASIDSKGLHTLHDSIASHLKAAGLPVHDDFAFTPHVTLAYVPADAPNPVQRVEPQPLTIDRVYVCYGDERHAIPLGSEQGWASDESSVKAQDSMQRMAVAVSASGMPAEADPVGELAAALTRRIDASFEHFAARLRGEVLDKL